MAMANQKRPIRIRFAVSAILAGTIAAGMLGSAAPAQAADTYLALAYQQSYGFGGKLVYRDAHGVGQTGGGQCEVRVVARNECAAVAASNGAQGWKIATATSYNQQLAEQIALASNGGGLIVVSACPS